MSVKPIPVWKEAPFLRLLIPFIFGIIVQWYLPIPLLCSLSFFIIFLVLLLLFQLARSFIQFKFYWVNGVLINVLLFFTSVIFTYYHDISHKAEWIKNDYKNGAVIIATLEEPLSEKDKSLKAEASVKSIIINDTLLSVKGSIIIYFQKDSLLPSLNYGSQIVFNKPLQLIKNSGNPAAFDYQRYCAFQDIYHQVYLKHGEFVVMPEKKESIIKKFLFSVRTKTLAIFQKNLSGEKERGLAEALMIGYKDDLDKTLVQSYTNTGVVHIIAISGMQLALIYGFLLLLFKPLEKLRFTKFIKPLTILVTLWLFSLMSGASASVLRAAVMVTCIVVGESLSKRTSIYNTLAASAFLLLCYNPFWLWDVGFQLSYIAVLSIVIFMKPIYNLVYIRNKLLNFIWELVAVSISAQILTTPISVFHFHQFPNYFLITNLVAVPLSSVILFGELILCSVAFIPFIAKLIGIILNWLVWLMNSFIEHMETLPQATWNNLQINMPQLIFCYVVIAGISLWLFFKNKSALLIALSSILCFTILRSLSFWQASDQQKLIVYNIPQHQAIDFIGGRNYLFKGDSILQEDGFLKNFHLKPSRIKSRISQADSISAVFYGNTIFQFGSKKIIVIDRPVSFFPERIRIEIAAIIISKNPKIKIANLAAVFNCSQWIFDGSNASWNISKWKTECDDLHLNCYDVSEKGAFVMNVD
jgi:competence protein ComEC